MGKELITLLKEENMKDFSRKIYMKGKVLLKGKMESYFMENGLKTN